MLNYRFFIPFLFLLFALNQSNAQYFELGLMGGGSNYLGDVSQNSQKIYWNETHWAGGLFVGYNLNDFISLKLHGDYMKISGADTNGEEVDVIARNAAFTSQLFEGHLRAEWNIMGFQAYNFSRPYSPYLFAGIGTLKFDPKRNDGQDVSLVSLGTEGQTLEGGSGQYSTLVVTVPMGVGFKFLLSESLTIGIEAGMRIAFSDYLDDVSGDYVSYDELLKASTLSAEWGNPARFPQGTKRGDIKARDKYYFAGLSISYNFIDNGLSGGRKKSKRRKSGCPTD